MAGFTDVLEQRVLQHFFRTSLPQPQPGALYVGLFTAPPTDAGGGNEVTGAGYARQTVAFNITKGADGRWQAANSATITFPVAGASGWGTVSHFGVFDAATTGTLYAFAELTDPATGYVTPLPKSIDYGDTVRFDPGTLILAID